MTLGYVVQLPLFCQGSKWPNGKSVWPVFRRFGFKFQLDPELLLSQQKIIINFISAYCEIIAKSANQIIPLKLREGMKMLYLTISASIDNHLLWLSHKLHCTACRILNSGLPPAMSCILGRSKKCIQWQNDNKNCDTILFLEILYQYVQ